MIVMIKISFPEDYSLMMVVSSRTEDHGTHTKGELGSKFPFVG